MHNCVHYPRLLSLQLDDKNISIISVRVDGLGMRWRRVELDVGVRQVRS